MVIALIAWWYGAGWSLAATRYMKRVATSLEFFSVGLLLRTLFDPFRQIGMEGGGQSLDAQFRAWGDRAFSRMVGFIMRTMVIIFGLTIAGVLFVVGLVQIALWPLVPLVPVVGVWLAATGFEL